MSERLQERSLLASVGNLGSAENTVAVKNRIGIWIIVVMVLRIKRVEHELRWYICELLQCGDNRRLLSVLAARNERQN